ncbi:nuclear transport factor 2 family protein [Myxococcus sp. AS-1-15]|uniref:nuclear transport factor 2 family protein n=1 Tax=Myxococcus TaxID=32 RepID=UPI001CBAD644|nr:nuclear transport factor 2 family protein [Myxococcus sp. AS-1-15]MBZ4395519.1 nuclear transport factor 2 family protein [Myxococcus sp. AS-1-15]
MTPQKPTEDVQALLSLEQSIVRAIHARDTRALEGLMAKDLVFRMGDTQTDRATFLDNVASIPGTILAVETESVSAHVFGDTGVLMGTQRARVRLPDGTEVTDVGHFTDVCQRRDGHWWVVLAHNIAAPQDTAPAPR